MWILILTIILIIILLFFISVILVFYTFIMRSPVSGKNAPSYLMGNRWKNHQLIIKQKEEWLTSRNQSEHSIITKDNLVLNGVFYPTNGASKKVVILCHGYMAYGMKDFAAIAAFYLENNVNVLMIDMRAHGKSKGNIIGFGVLERNDLLQWIKYINRKFNYDCNIFLHGISMGGATVLMVNEFKLPENVKGSIADCAFTSAYEEFKYMLKNNFHLPTFPILPIANFICKKIGKYGFKDVNTLDILKQATLPILFIHGNKDRFIPIDMTKQNYHACSSEKYLFIVNNAHHCESYYMDMVNYQNHVIDFINRYSKK